MILIVGAGAVGTIVSAYLTTAKREPVKLYVREKDIPALQAVQDIRVEHAGSTPPIVAPKPLLTRSLALDEVDYLLICVKFPQLDGLLDELDTAAERCTLVSTLNGVGALRRIRERFPQARVAPMTIMFNGQLLEPLHAQITTKPHVLIGSDDTRLLRAFGDSGMQVTRVAGESAAWGKLLINLANAICALTHTTFKDLLTQPDMRAIYVAAIDEAVRLLDAAGIDYKLPMPIPYPVYRALLAGRTPLPWWFAKLRNGLQDGSYPSMVADVGAGRKTEVGQLNGEIVRLGLEHELPTPVNARIVSLIQKIEGQAPPPYLTPAQLRERLGV